MTISKRRKLLLSQLDEHLAALDNASLALVYSFDKCSDIGEKEEYDLEEQESFEALTSRFARTSDILTQKVFKTLFILLQENIKTIIDAANFLEKLEVIEEADDLLNIREIRNQIAHEYVDSDIKALFFDVLHYVPEMKKIIKNVKVYYDKNLSSNKAASSVK
jgi:uncharacterized protein YutE (UPF0331/DUF86 family)